MSEFEKFDTSLPNGGCFNESDPVSLTEWKELTDEQKAEVIRLRIGGKLRCYELSTLMGQYTNKQFFDPETRIEWSAYQKKKIREALDQRYGISKRAVTERVKEEGEEEEEEQYVTEDGFQCACVNICKEERIGGFRCPYAKGKGQAKICIRTCKCKRGR